MAGAPQDPWTADTGCSSRSSCIDELRKSKFVLNSNTNNNTETRLEIKDHGPAWLRTITDVGKETANNPSQKSKIPKVPDGLRKRRTNPKKYCYDPSMLSIGPYHHKNLDQLEFPTELYEMDKLKLRMVNQFVQDSGTPIGELYKKVAEVASTRRQCYCAASVASMSDEKFAQIMFVDGCFVLQFILCVTCDYHKLRRSDQDVAFLRRDLLLLENQLPCHVLKSLMESSNNNLKKYSNDIRHHVSGLMWEQLIDDFIEIRGPRFALSKSVIKSALGCVLEVLVFCFGRICATVVEHSTGICRIFRQKGEDFQSSTIKEEEDHVHLLGRLYEQLVNKKTMDVGNPHYDIKNYHGQYLYYSAQHLSKVGIYFKPSSSSALTDVEFKSNFLSGTLRLPPITIDVSTESMLLNLVAFELHAYQSPEHCHWVTAYICFMDSLINDVEDVRKLRSSGIIYNYLGTDQDVADLFNEMAKDLVPNPYAFGNVRRKIDLQCQSSVKKWVAEFKHDYCSSPWTSIATAAAAFAAIQTYLGAFNY